MRLLPLLLVPLLAVGCAGKDDTGGDTSGPTEDLDGDGFTTAQGDCDDTDPDVNPDAAEVWYDTIDQDCDGNDSDQDRDGYTVESDCVDTDPTVHPNQAEVPCDGIDQNCDGADLIEGGGSGWEDADADGYGSAASPVDYCGTEPPDGVVDNADDCDDAHDDVYPGAPEQCNDRDDDCDDVTDEDAVDAPKWYYDADLDGYGDPERSAETCDAPAGYVENGDDCDDAEAATSPAATEVCDGVDNDCDGDTDEDAPATTWYLDADADGYGDDATAVESCGSPGDGWVELGGDCDDSDVDTSPGAAEQCDGLDNDCDGSVDEDVSTTTWYADTDADGHGDPSVTAEECARPDGYVADGDDCDDGDAAVNPDADEVCNGVDDDCDGVVDTDASDRPTWYLDADADGWGGSVSYDACEAPEHYVAADGDCDDATATVHPGADELCNTIDDDCDGAVDEAGALDESTWYLDGDGDGWGGTETTTACDLPSGYSELDGDCDDDDAAINPDAAEADDLVDDDCDGWVDEDFVTTGAIVITEVARQTRFGASASTPSGNWFEIYNPDATRTLDLTNAYIIRAADGVYDAFLVEPSAGLLLGPGEYAVFCKTEDYVGAAGAAVPLACDYVWGDPDEAADYSGYYHDNTFNLQRDEDVLSVYFAGGTVYGTLLDSVHWTYDATNGYWPRVATRTMALDPALLDASSNDDVAAWCSTATDPLLTWWTDGSSAAEYGTPGRENPSCE